MGGEQARTPFSPDKAAIAKTTVKTTAADIRCRYVIVSPQGLVKLVLREFSNAKSERPPETANAWGFVPAFVAQGFYHPTGKESLT
jgi:hypothetical protein